MLQLVFTVYDQKADAFLPPWIMPKAVMAQRIFSDCVNSKDHQFHAHPEDYTLFLLGDWDDEKAEFTPLPNGKRSLGVALEYVKKENDSRQMDLVTATEGPDHVESEPTHVQPSAEGRDSSE